MARLSALILLSCALAGLLSSMPAQAAAVSTTGRSLTDTTVAPVPEGDIDSAEDVADETEQEAEEVGADIEDGTETAVDEVDSTGEEAVDEVGDAGEGAVDEVDATGEEAVDEVGDAGEGAADEVESTGEEAVDEVASNGEEAADDVEDAFTDSAAGTSLAIAVSAAVAGLAALAA